MATDKLINQTQGADIIEALSDIATNVGNITYGPQTSADKVVSMTGYAKAPAEAAISQGDTLNEAIGKLEKKADDNATAVADKIDKLTSATAGDIATVTATGEIADSAVAIETTLSDSSDAEVPTSKAVGTYVDGKGYAVGVSSSTANNLVAFNDANGKALKDSGISVATSTTGLADSDTAVPTSKTVKTYVDSTATGISRYLGTITAASGLSTDAKKGDFYIVKTAWTGVHVGDEIIAEKNSPSQTIDGTNWSLLHNEADTDTKYTFGTGDTNGTFKVTPSDTGTAQPVSIYGLNSAAYTTADTSSLTNDNNHVPTSALAKTLLDEKVPTTRKVNNKALSTDITLSASDVSAVPTGNVTTVLPASSAAASTSKVMSEKLVYDTYVPNSDFVVATDNIKYTINTGAKNQLKLTGNVCNPNTLYVYWDYENGTVRVTGSKATTSTVFINLGSWTAPEDGVYRIFANSAACTANIRVYDDANWNTYTAGGASNEATWTKGTTRTLYLRIASNFVVGDITVTPMICQKSVFDADSSFVPYGAPNSDLSALEAEDRAALAEEIDASAKNLLKRTASGSSWTDDNVTFTLNSDGSITINSSGAITANRYFAYFEGRMSDLISTAGNYVLFANASPNTQAQVWWYYTDDWTNVIETSGNSSSYISASYLNRPIIVRIRALTGNAISNVKVYPMICTKAAFGVSSKFVPYRPNWDLVASVNKYEKTNMVFTTDSAITSVFDLENSYAYQYYNAFLGKVIVYMDLLTKASISTLDSKTIAWVKNGTNNTYNFEWTQPVTSGDAIFRFTKPNTSTGVVMRLQSGTVAAGVHIYVRFEYDIY